MVQSLAKLKWCLLAACVALTAASSARASTVKIPLVTYYSPSRGDYFTTTQDGWNCEYFNTCNNPYILDYVPVGMQGLVFSPDGAQPPNTVPLFHWFSPVRGDNFLTTNPHWAGRVGDSSTEGGWNYFLFRIEGFISTTFNGMPLNSYFNPTVEDNAAIATWRNRVPAGYTFFRTEGFLLPPDSPSLARCMANLPPTTTDPNSWQARGNYVDSWVPQAGFESGDTVRFTAPADWYRIDYWGHTYPVRGYSTGLAGTDYPLPGEAAYAMMGRVTTGRAFVAGRGWFEANTWFRALGDSFDSPGACVFFNGDGAVPPQLQTSYNDPNISDNGGWANVKVQQWF